MSYDQPAGLPEDLTFSVDHGKLVASFTCPRCKNLQVCIIDPKNIIDEFNLDCSHPSCTSDSDGERFGFRLNMVAHWTQWFLSLQDRPLHE